MWSSLSTEAEAFTAGRSECAVQCAPFVRLSEALCIQGCGVDCAVNRMPCLSCICAMEFDGLQSTIVLPLPGKQQLSVNALCCQVEDKQGIGADSLGQPYCNWCALGSSALQCQMPSMTHPALPGFFVQQVAYAPDPEGGILSRALLGIEMWLTCFGRSMALFYFLSVLHAFWWCIPCHAGAEASNLRIRGMRRGFSGAPLFWAFRMMAHLLPVAVAAPGVSYPGSDCASPDACDLVGHSFESRRRGGVDHSLGVLAGDLHRTVCNDFKVQVAVFQYQRPAFCLEIWWDVGMDSGLLCAEVTGDLSLDAELHKLLPVHPQPSVDVAVFIAVPPWLVEELWVPILIQVGEPVELLFMDFFVGRITHFDVMQAVGEHWSPDALVLVGSALEPLDEHASFMASPGDLVRVVKRRTPVRVSTLDDKLMHPWGRLRNLLGVTSRCMEPDDPHVGVVGPLADWHTFSVHLNTSQDGLRDRIVEHCAGFTSDARFKAPCQHPYDVAFRGKQVASIVGVLPSHADHCPYVFVDPRALGKPICVLILPPVPTPIHSLLRILQISCPSWLRVVVRGAPLYVPERDTFVPRAAALITLTVESLTESHHLQTHGSDAAQMVPPLPLVRCEGSAEAVRSVCLTHDPACQTGCRAKPSSADGDTPRAASKVVLSLSDDLVWRELHPDGGGPPLTSSVYDPEHGHDVGNDDVEGLTPEQSESEDDGVLQGHRRWRGRHLTRLFMNGWSWSRL